ERLRGLLLVSQIGPHHRLPVLGIICAPHAPLVAVPDVRSADIGELLYEDQPLDLPRPRVRPVNPIVRVLPWIVLVLVAVPVVNRGAEPRRVVCRRQISHSPP